MVKVDIMLCNVECIHTHADAHTDMYICIHLHKCKYIHTCINVYTHIRINAHTHIHTHRLRGVTNLNKRVKRFAFSHLLLLRLAVWVSDLIGGFFSSYLFPWPGMKGSLDSLGHSQPRVISSNGLISSRPMEDG